MKSRLSIFILLWILSGFARAQEASVEVPGAPPSAPPTLPGIEAPSSETMMENTVEKQDTRRLGGKGTYLWAEVLDGRIANGDIATKTSVDKMTGKGIRLTQEFGHGPLVLETGVAYHQYQFTIEKYHMQHVVPDAGAIFFCELFGGSYDGCKQPYDFRNVDASNTISVSTLGVPIAAKLYFFPTRYSRPFYITGGVMPFWNVGTSQTDTRTGLYVTNSGNEVYSHLQNFNVMAMAALGLQVDVNPKFRLSGEVGVNGSLASIISGESYNFAGYHVSASLGYAF